MSFISNTLIVCILSLTICHCNAGNNTSNCTSNQQYTTCLNPCPKTCKNPFPPICHALQCKKGCECKSDYFLNNQKECVLPTDCVGSDGPSCSENEHEVLCLSPCPATCDRPNPPKCNPIYCVPGCHCKRGYVRKCTECVALEDCPK